MAKKKKPLTPGQQIARRFSSSIEWLGGLEDYPFIEDVTLPDPRAWKERLHQPRAEISFGELVQGAEEARWQALPLDEKRFIATQLERFLVGRPKPRKQKIKKPESDPVHAAEAITAEDVVSEPSSYEVEREFRESLSELISHPQFGEIAERKIGEFWRPEWVRSPFEEAMSFRQMASVDLIQFFRKKSMNPRRIAALAQVFRQALAISKGEADAGPSDNEILTRWKECEEELPRILRPTVRVLIEQCQKAKRLHYPLARAMAVLLEVVEPRSFFDAWQHEELGGSGELTDEVRNSCMRVFEKGPEMRRHLDLAFRTGSIPFPELARYTLIDELDKGIQEVLLALLLRSFGATQEAPGAFSEAVFRR